MKYLTITNSAFEFFLKFTMICCVLLSGERLQAKQLEDLKLDEMKYLVDLGLLTTRGREYNLAAATAFAKDWPEILSLCKEKLVKTPNLNVKFYLVIRSDGSAAHAIADDRENIKASGTLDDDSMGCVGEYILSVKYPSHTFSYFFWTFTYSPDLLEHLGKETVGVSSQIDQVWRSSESSAVVALFSDRRIYLCYGSNQAKGAGRTMATLGYIDDKALIHWGASYMMYQGELINVNEESPNKSIKFSTLLNSEAGLLLKGAGENLLFGERLTKIPATCDRPI